jgi:hypothetical protein
VHVAGRAVLLHSFPKCVAGKAVRNGVHDEPACPLAKAGRTDRARPLARRDPTPAALLARTVRDHLREVTIPLHHRPPFV